MARVAHYKPAPQDCVEATIGSFIMSVFLILAALLFLIFTGVMLVDQLSSMLSDTTSFEDWQVVRPALLSQPTLLSPPPPTYFSTAMQQSQNNHTTTTTTMSATTAATAAFNA